MIKAPGKRRLFNFNGRIFSFPEGRQHRFPCYPSACNHRNPVGWQARSIFNCTLKQYVFVCILLLKKYLFKYNPLPDFCQASQKLNKNNTLAAKYDHFRFMSAESANSHSRYVSSCKSLQSFMVRSVGRCKEWHSFVLPAKLSDDLTAAAICQPLRKGPGILVIGTVKPFRIQQHQ